MLVCRNKDKAVQTVDEIVHSTRNPKVRFELADLSRHTDVRELAERWRGPLHVLVNNAVKPRSRQDTPEGIELQFATNVLGYFWLIDEFTDVLKTSAPTRVVNVAVTGRAVWISTIWSSPVETTIMTRLTVSPNKRTGCSALLFRKS